MRPQSASYAHNPECVHSPGCGASRWSAVNQSGDRLFMAARLEADAERWPMPVSGPLVAP